MQVSQAGKTVSGWKSQLAACSPFFGTLVAEVLGVWFLTRLLLSWVREASMRCLNKTCMQLLCMIVLCKLRNIWTRMQSLQKY